ncbi:hypothetical protein PF008_g4451 [Phytophthora fragariae]|uniref:Uncharacterized protein n=1 Tax=Phytophthora fragariae TaxID=53985 RepID=A0A6G0SB83_9STRA|nr:hypothetical protein PF008_g4451 [Phytophthora fragariae]
MSLATACANTLWSPINSASLFVVVDLPSAVVAAHLGLADAASAPTSTMTLPLPPGPGFPLDPPSKKPSSDPVVGVLLPLQLLRSIYPSLHILRMKSVTRNFGSVSAVSGNNPIRYLIIASSTLLCAPVLASLTVCSFLPSGCTLSTFRLQMCVNVTATPTCHKSCVTSVSRSHCSNFVCLPHLVNHAGISRILKLKISGTALARS